MKAYISNIENETLNNDNFRKVLFTGAHSQLVVMSLLPGEEIGLEVHEENDQFFRFEAGAAKVIVGDEENIIGPDFVLIVKAGTKHNIINISAKDKLKFYTIYSPPHHPDKTIHATKEEAIRAEETE